MLWTLVTLLYLLLATCVSLVFAMALELAVIALLLGLMATYAFFGLLVLAAGLLLIQVVALRDWLRGFDGYRKAEELADGEFAEQAWPDD